MNSLEYEMRADLGKTSHTIAWALSAEQVAQAYDPGVLVRFEEESAERRLRRLWPDRKIEKGLLPDSSGGMRGYVRAKAPKGQGL